MLLRFFPPTCPCVNHRKEQREQPRPVPSIHHGASEVIDLALPVIPLVAPGSSAGHLTNVCLESVATRTPRARWRLRPARAERWVSTMLRDSALPHKWAPDLAEDGWRKDRGQGETNSKSWKVSSVRREPSSRLLFPPPPHPHPSLLRGDPSLHMKLCRLYMVSIKPYMWHINKSFNFPSFKSNFCLLNLILEQIQYFNFFWGGVTGLFQDCGWACSSASLLYVVL